jgi:hypothetical protein
MTTNVRSPQELVTIEAWLSWTTLAGDASRSSSKQLAAP